MKVILAEQVLSVALLLFAALSATVKAVPARAHSSYVHCDCENSRRIREPKTLGRDGKVYNGSPAELGSFPWQVSVQEKMSGAWKHICGGSLVNDRYVVTASHCLGEHDDKSDYRVIVGSLDNRDFPENAVFQVVDFKNYPDAGNIPWEHDVAIMQIHNGQGEGVTCSEAVSPICLGEPSIITTSSDIVGCYVSGWGITGTDQAPAKLQYAQITKYSSDECDRFWNLVNEKKVFGGNMTCAGIHGSSTGASPGDSGGPLACFDEGRLPYLSGVVSQGKGSSATSPSIYTDVSQTLYRKWIQEEMDKWDAERFNKLHNVVSLS